MKIKKYAFCFGVLVVVFLIANSQPAGALTLNIVKANEQEQLVLEMSKYFQKRVESKAGEVKVNISNSENYTVSSALLYLCKDRNPIDCIKSKPIEFANKADTTLRLDEIQANGKAGLLSLVKANQSWFAGWDYIENGTVQNTDPGEVDIHSSVNIKDIKDFIEAYGMVPAAFVDKVDYKGKTAYQTTGIESRRGRSENITLTNPKAFSGLEKDLGYIFSFPASQKIYSPMTFYNEPRICGDAKCDIGENYETCWYDCACPAGQIASRSGCVPKSSVKMIVDKIEPKPVDCFSTGLVIEKNAENASCAPSTFQIDYHLENAPVNYSSKPQFYYEMNAGSGPKPTTYAAVCYPQDLANLKLSIDELLKPQFYNTTDYQCIIKPPILHKVRGQTDSRSILLGMYMSVLAQNGTETIHASNLTTVPLDILGVDLSEMEDLQTKLNSQKKWISLLGDILLTIAWIATAFTIAWVAFAICIGIGRSLVWAFGVGAVLEAKCRPLFATFFPTGLKLAVILYLVGFAVNLCAGFPIDAPLLNLPATPSFVGIDFKGAAFEIVNAENAKQASKGILAILVGGAVGALLAYAIADYFTGSIAILAVSTVVGAGIGFLGTIKACGKIANLEDKMKQKIEEAKVQQESKFKSLVSNLLWASGNVTGRSATLCGNENVKGFYNFNNLDCDDGLWFGFNGKARPTCNFTSGAWLNEKDRVFGDNCSPANTTEYEWVVQNSSRENLGVRNYNTTDAFQFFEKPANLLFNPAKNGTDLSVFVNCNNPVIGSVQDEFRLANYTEVCE